MDNTPDNNNSNNNNNNEIPPPPLIHIPPTNTLNAIRSTYMNLFNQILDNSFNINCICKTTFKSNALSAATSSQTTKKCNIFDKGHNDFMSDDDEDEEFMNDKNENDIEMQGNVLNEEPRRHLERDMILLELDYAEESPSNVNNSNNNKKMSKICDLSCFEHMRYVHSTLKNCFSTVAIANEASLSTANTQSNLDKFEAIWESLKFLKKNPKSCDYYGSTLFHYAAADDQRELLKCLVEKDSTGVFCIDSKGKRFDNN